jgi:hypothetical protein
MIRIFTDFAPSPVVVAKVRRLERRRELVVQGPGTAGKSDDCAISHCIDGTVSVQIATGRTLVWNRSGVKRRYCALVAVAQRGGRRHPPDLSPSGATRERSFSLNGLKTVREKLEGQLLRQTSEVISLREKVAQAKLAARVYGQMQDDEEAPGTVQTSRREEIRFCAS